MKTKSQSAMEYLMTYGWAILIIAVILGVLFSLGVFNPVNYAPRVPAGNCHVFRPNGPGTNFNVNLVGTCSGFLPQYVAGLDEQASQAYVNVPSDSALSLTTQGSISFWIYSEGIPASGPCNDTIGKGSSTANMNYNVYLSTSSCLGGSNPIELMVEANAGGTWTPVSPISTTAINVNTWYNVIWTYSASGSGSLYINGASQGSVAGKGALYSNSDNLTIGRGLDGSAPGLFLMSNVQIYNTSLTANEVQYLYNEGIGGAPVYLSHLVGWWPLNGDTKDYSGNGNHGTPVGITFNGSWTTGYSQP